MAGAEREAQKFYNSVVDGRLKHRKGLTAFHVDRC